MVEYLNFKDLFWYCKIWYNEKKVNLCSKGVKWNKLKFVFFLSDDNFDFLLFLVYSKCVVENGVGWYLLCYYVIIYILIVYVFCEVYWLYINDFIYKMFMFIFCNNFVYLLI